MGTPIPPPTVPEPVPAGDACAICWGSGKPFGGGDTPGTIDVSVSGINKTPSWVGGDGEPVDGDFVLTQSISTPCLFEYTEFFFGILVQFFSGATLMQINGSGGAPDQFLGGAGECELLAYNALGVKFSGGSIQVTIPEVS